MFIGYARVSKDDQNLDRQIKPHKDAYAFVGYTQFFCGVLFCKVLKRLTFFLRNRIKD